MLRLLFILVSFACWHLRADRRKGSHRQGTHGNRYSGSGKGRKLVKAGGSKSSGKATKSGADAFKSKKTAKPKPPPDDDDDDDLDFLGKGSSTNESRGEGAKAKPTAQERHEAKLINQREKEERSRVHSAIKDMGGLKTRDDLRDEYSQIPNTFKRRDGMAGDDLAEHLAQYYPEFGIESERDLIDFLAA